MAISTDIVRSTPLRLDAGNFELAVQTYRHLAVLFYDQTPVSDRLIHKWTEVGTSRGLWIMATNFQDVYL